MADETVGPAEADDGRAHAVFGKHFERARAEAAGDGAIFERDDELSRLGLFDQQGGVDGLGETGVNHADGETGLGGKFFGERLGFGHHRAERPELDVDAGPEDFGFTERNKSRLRLDRLAGGGATGVADEHRGTGLQRGVQHVRELILVLRLH